MTSAESGLSGALPIRFPIFPLAGAILLLVVALVATLLPAERVTRIDPATALRA